MPTTKFFLIPLFFPVWLVFWFGWFIYEKFWGKSQSKKAQQNKELKQKWQKHLRNFDPSRVKNKTWQKSLKNKKNLKK